MVRRGGKPVRLPQDALISDEKLVKYLLAPKKRNDKSKWLAQAGYTLENWPLLKEDIRQQVLPKSASLIESTDYGKMYEVRARLKGPNGKSLLVRTVWMVEAATNTTKFITMYPDRRRSAR
jgi:hypothetical protein